jgi:hypothetical protein
MEILIVSKTRMRGAVCVVGLVLSNNRYVRLLNPGGCHQPTDTTFEVGDIYDIDFKHSMSSPPHVEDVIICSKTFVRKIDNMASFLLQKDVIDWKGHIDNLFNGLLSWTEKGTGYIPEKGTLPKQSVGFWIADKDIVLNSFDGSKFRYKYPDEKKLRNLVYVGYQNSIELIPAGTILRVSLSRIFPPISSEISVPRGYYLQLSGWYVDN